MAASHDPFGRPDDEPSPDEPRDGLPPWLLPMIVADLVIIAVVLVVFVLAEVFREGARLRRESELTI